MADLTHVVVAWNQVHPVGTPVTFWPGVREGAGKESHTRTPAWLVGEVPCVSVEGYAGGIALTHILPGSWPTSPHAAPTGPDSDEEQSA